MYIPRRFDAVSRFERTPVNRKVPLDRLSPGLAFSYNFYSNSINRADSNHLAIRLMQVSIFKEVEDDSSEF